MIEIQLALREVVTAVLTHELVAKEDIVAIEFTSSGQSHEYKTLLDSPAAEKWPAVSPDGNWLAYASDITGRFEIYVRPYPITDSPASQVSFAGGTKPVWRSDGGEIYYHDRSNVMSRSVEIGPELSFGEPEPLFNHRRYGFHEGNHYSAQDKFAYATDPLGLESSKDQIIYVRDWRMLLNDASAKP